MPKPQWATRRWMLSIEAYCWRFLMDIGMSLHRLAPPRPMRTSFTKYISSTVSTRHAGGKIKLVFYVPDEYNSTSSGGGERWPVVVNFHGGGMTIGKPEDDATWATATVTQCRVVVVSVGYRLAPRHYFPTPVEDGVDAILHLVRNAADLHLDPHRIITSGFSAGGNLCFTVPLALSSPTLLLGQSLKVESGDFSIIATIAFYPSVNFTTTRTQRRATNIRQDRNLAEFFTDLFDAAYLFPADCAMTHPLLSPGAAPDALLRLLPPHIHFYTAEWDELQAEARDFHDRLQKLGCQSRYRMLEGQVHAWDRGPNPLRENKLRGLVYKEACTALNRILEGDPVDERLGEERVEGLHVTEQVNDAMQAYVHQATISKAVGADTPDRPATPKIMDEEILIDQVKS